MIYAFEGIDPSLDAMPLAAERALQAAGLRVSSSDWRALSLKVRRSLVSLGADDVIAVQETKRALVGAKVQPRKVAERPMPAPREAPAAIARALGHEIAPSTWRALSNLDRYALVKVASRAQGDRLARAYNEIVLIPEPREPRSISTHLSKSGDVHMVDVGAKDKTLRRAIAEARVTMDASTASRLRDGGAGKGDVLATARIAGIQGAKRTSDLIPLCHVIAITRVAIDLVLGDRGVTVTATVEANDRTGVEMEAMVAASTSALTIYDMLKGTDRGMTFDVRLLEKSGGRTGLWKRA